MAIRTLRYVLHSSYSFVLIFTVIGTNSFYYSAIRLILPDSTAGSGSVCTLLK